MSTFELFTTVVCSVTGLLLTPSGVPLNIPGLSTMTYLTFTGMAPLFGTSLGLSLGSSRVGVSTIGVDNSLSPTSLPGVVISRPTTVGTRAPPGTGFYTISVR